MNWLIPNRQHVAQLKYQLRKFEEQCAELPAETRRRIHQVVRDMNELLGEPAPDCCTDYGGQCNYERPPFSLARYCVACGMMHPDDVPPVEVAP